MARPGHRPLRPPETGRGAEITYEFEDFELLVPSSASPDATHAKWRMTGVIKIRTRDAIGG